MAGHVFISHSSRDGGIAGELRAALVAYGVPVWEDARQLTPGDQLDAAIRQALDEASAVVAILSPRTINSRWVTREIRHALGLQKERGPEYRVIPLMVDGIEPSGLHAWFPDEVLGLTLRVGPGGVQNMLPDLLAALGLILPSAGLPSSAVEASPISDLTLELSDPYIDRSDGKLRSAATGELTYSPAEPGSRDVRSRRFKLVAPLGPIEAEDLRWYLERYVSWPTGVFQERAKGVEARLPVWGRLLHAAMLEHDLAREAYEPWKRCRNGGVRRLTVLVDRDLIAGSPEPDSAKDQDDSNQRRAEADEAASMLLGLPWELLHDDTGYLFHGPSPVRVRRQLPNRKEKRALATAAPLRVLLLSPRPEEEGISYIDHRVSARPVVEALSSLGELAELKLLSPATFAALAEELDRAQQQGKPYHVVHFDGHGVYARQTGLGALCFERAEDSEKVQGRRTDIVDATRLAAVMRDQRVPLFFLEACQTARAEKDPTASVAGTLLQGGVASVVAMSHSVLVETARRFVTVFYRELLAGRRIGEAMVAGQRHLKAQTFRYLTFQGELHLEDWFVPVLYQEEDDPQLIREVPAQRVQEVLARRREVSLGELPQAPEHGFVGRSRELLTAERRLEEQPYVVLVGEGGEGKTTLASELARWLVATRRYERAAFASLEKHGDVRSLLLALGSQLVVDYISRAGMDEGRGWLEVERALRERRTLVVLDNMESVLPPEPTAPTEAAFEPEVLEKVLELAQHLSAVGKTGVVFTSRQAMPSPFANNHVLIGRLERLEAIDLVASVLGKTEQGPLADDPGESEDDVLGLVDAVGCHARSLVLLAREVADSGVRSATGRLGELMTRLHDLYPNDRERSLYASVELSLQRLPAGMRELIRPLGVFRGGGQLAAMAFVLGLESEEPQRFQGIVASLVRAGLAEPLEYNYLRLDPALGPLLLSELSETDHTTARNHWAEAMVRTTSLLYKATRGEYQEMAAALTLLDLSNLLSALEHLQTSADAQVVVTAAVELETLLCYRGRPKALARASRVRDVVSAGLNRGSHGWFVAERQAVERLLEAGRYPEATKLARTIVEQKEVARGTALDGEGDLPIAHLLFGRSLKLGGDSAAALAPLREAFARLDALADAGGRDASQMASVALTEMGDCFRHLGRFSDAVKSYEGAIARKAKLEDVRGVAVNKGQLGAVRLLQGRYGEALAAYEDALRTLEQLGELRFVAVVRHQVGIVHRHAKRYDKAEEAFQASLQIKVPTGDRSGEAATLLELSFLYHEMGRAHEAVRFGHQAATAFRELKNLAAEGIACGALAAALLTLGQYGDARREVLRALVCKQPFGDAAKPWMAFSLLENIERESGNLSEAGRARRQAINGYLAYRRSGGESLSHGFGNYLHVAQAIATGQTVAANAELAAIMERADLPTGQKALVSAHQAILCGARDPSLAADPDLAYHDAAELQLFLEYLTRKEEP